MIRISTPDGVDARIISDPRLSAAQRSAIASAGRADNNAVVLGLDSKLRPVIRTRASGPGKRVEYALLRNGDPVKVTTPLTEYWGRQESTHVCMK